MIGGLDQIDSPIGDSIPNSAPTQCQESILPLIQSLKIPALYYRLPISLQEEEFTDSS